MGDTFAEFGPVKSVLILRDRRTRRSKGYIIISPLFSLVSLCWDPLYFSRNTVYKVAGHILCLSLLYVVEQLFSFIMMPLLKHHFITHLKTVGVDLLCLRMWSQWRELCQQLRTNSLSMNGSYLPSI